MSVCFENIVTIARKLCAAEARPDSLGVEFVQQLQDVALWEAARSAYFLDDHSRRVFDWVQQYRAASSFFAGPLPIELENQPFSADEWRALEQQAAAMITGFVEGDYLLDRLDIWLLECYSLHGECEVNPGDTVFDCGAFTGNSSLFFSQKAGETGRVYGFEAAAPTFLQYSKNMQALGNVTPVQAAVYDTTGHVRFTGTSAAARVDDAGEPVCAVTLDDFVAQHAVQKVDFIKMDIEGAEAQALEGARRTIQTYRPKMALSAYHKADDVITLPALVRAIAPGYTFKLRHYSNVECETVLFCIPEKAQANALDEEKLLPPPFISPERYKEILCLMLPLLLSAFKGYDGSIGQRTAQIIESLGDTDRALAFLTQENEQLRKENFLLHKAMQKIADYH